MLVESLLAYAHFTAILTMVVFLSSEAALCRVAWLNAEVVRRLVRVDLIYGLSALAVLLTGGLRTWLGMKGTHWYWTQPMLHVKLGLFVLIAILSIKPTLSYLRWRRTLEATGALPDPAEITAVRRRVMVQAHLLVLIPLAAAMLARGVGF
jgi:putative membrane protein